ncbi:MAG: LuxR C-terminal-related transcriptional regulator [Gemmatimonadaceae bacterium]|jgi:HD-GYP domain-containing protein (c-di-GMP phosphodiesterase class II)|nr:LuxR C-terminal-related transcriptional regulator [Gemmatimonadaceae bacterium]
MPSRSAVPSCPTSTGSAPARAPDTLRLAELLGALSLATDLADGFPPEKTIRTARAAVLLARALGADAATVHDVYWSAVLLFVGCTAYAPEESRLSAGEDIALRTHFGQLDGASRLEEWRTIATITRHAGRRRQLASVWQHVAHPALSAGYAAAQCEVAVRLAARLGMSPSVQAALAHKEEHFDGSGGPAGLVGDAIALPMRIVRAAHVFELFLRLAGRNTALDVLAARAGRQLDPTVVAALSRDAEPYIDALTARGAWDAFLACEPGPLRTTTDLTTVARTFAHFVDLKSVLAFTHSTGVAQLIVRVAPALGIASDRVVALEQAALLHDLGRVGVANAIWEKPGALDEVEWEQVRLHPYFTERTLRRAPALRSVAAIAAQHHERLDGSGYHAGLPGHMLSRESRLLAVCDVWHALGEQRAHRAAHTTAQAVAVVREAVRGGRLDRECATALLDTVAPGNAALTRTRPSGLTEREVEVLRLLAVGRTNKEIARALGIATRTIGHHVAHIYAKLGVSTRAGATLAAMERGVLD